MSSGELHKLPTNSLSLVLPASFPLPPAPPPTAFSPCCINNFRTLLSTLCAVSSALDKFAQFFDQSLKNKCSPKRLSETSRWLICKTCWPCQWRVVGGGGRGGAGHKQSFECFNLKCRLATTTSSFAKSARDFNISLSFLINKIFN